MAFRFKRKENLKSGFKRLLRLMVQQLAEHVTAPTDPEEHIHQARVTIKRIRALLRLTQAGLPRKTFVEANQYFRDLGRELSGAREADVLQQTWTALKNGTGLAEREVEPIVYRFFCRLVASQPSCLEPSVLHERPWLDLLPWQEEIEQTFKAHHDDWAILRDGIKKTYRLGQQAMDRAVTSQLEADYHEWRKRVKDRAYQLEYLSSLWPSIMATLVQELKRLGDLLGQHHDWAVLKRHLAQLAQQEPQVALHWPTWKSFIDAEQKQLAVEIYRLGSCLYADHPGNVSKRMRKYWQTWKKHGIPAKPYQTTQPMTKP